MKKNYHLTSNEKKALSLLTDNAKMTDSEIAINLKITPQAVNKIRKKLEENYIKEYRTVIDYKKLGINVFAIAQVNTKNAELLNIKNIIGAFEVNQDDVTHILILGFCSVEHLDKFKKKAMQVGDIKRLDVISGEGMLKNSPVDLLKYLLRQ